MNMQTTALVPSGAAGEAGAPLRPHLMGYVESLGLLERMHRLMLDVVKDEFERLGILDVNAVQAMLMYNVAGHEVTAGELKSRGYYQGSNVSYNLKKLVELGYMHHERCGIDRRAVRVRLTEKGHGVRDAVAALFDRHATTLEERGIVNLAGFEDANMAMRRMERFWSDQIRYIY